MSNSNTLPSQRVAIVGTVDPDANTVGDKNTDFASMADFDSIMAVISLGILGASATIDAKLEQATDASGTGKKDITGKAITQLVKATDDDKQAIINVRADELDVDGGFDFVRCELTVGTATSDTGVVLLGLDARYGPADINDKDLASVAEIVA